MTTKIISENDLGKGVVIEDNKLIIDIETDSGLDFNGNKLTIDISKLSDLLDGQVKVVSTDAGNLIIEGTDSKAMLKADDIKAVVGEMVASSTDGIDYDTLTKTLKAYLYSYTVEDTNSVDLTFTIDGDGDGTNGDAKLKADVKLSDEAGNGIEIKNDGLFAFGGTKPTLNDTDADSVTLDYADGSQLKLDTVTNLDGSIKYHVISASQ